MGTEVKELILVYEQKQKSPGEGIRNRGLLINTDSPSINTFRNSIKILNWKT